MSGRGAISRHLTTILLSPIRVFMSITGHRQDCSMTPVQPSEFAARARAQNYLEKLARDQEAHYVIKSAEDYLRDLDDQIAGRPRLKVASRH